MLGKPRGILKPQIGREKFHLQRVGPSNELRFFVEHYWIVTWDLDEPYVSENLPFPTIHLVIEEGKSGVFGVVTQKFTRHLDGQGRVFGVKFRPGSFHPFVNTPVSTFTNTVCQLNTLFGTAGDDLETRVLSFQNDDKRVATVEDFLLSYAPTRDENIALVNQIIGRMMTDRTLLKVEDLCNNISKRTLQRLFHQYIGVSPKWVIQRFRLHEAVEQMAANPKLDLNRLAHDLGYFDQSHFTRDFKALIGQTPIQYLRSL